jgi:site-specific DNA-methyltransferase (adenine-specific)
LNPYYEHAGITIYHGDCREILPHIKADVLVTDPPYGIAYKSGHEGDLPREIAGDADTALRDYALATFVGPAAAFASWRCRPWGTPRGCLVWDKREAGGMGDLSFPWRPTFEMVYIYGQGWSGHRGPSVLRGSTIHTWNSGAAKRLHPHEKPTEVLAQIIHKAPAGVALDPFMGSGTTLVAAKLEGRKAIGIEIEERYCEIAAKRLSQEVLPFSDLMGTAMRDADAQAELHLRGPEIEP